MIPDRELDLALGQLGAPDGAEPRTNAAAILARARLFAPPPAPVRPRFLAPTAGVALLAAGVILGVGLGRYTAPGAVAPADSAASAQAVAAPVVVAVPVFVPVPSGGGAPAAEETSAAVAAIHRAPGRQGGAAGGPRDSEAPTFGGSSGTAALDGPPAACPAEVFVKVEKPDTRELDELLAEELPTRELDPEALDARSSLPGAGDKRLERPARTPREPGEVPEELPREALASGAGTQEVEAPAGERLPLDMRVVVAGGASPGGPAEGQPRGGAEAALGLAWRPAVAGVSRPEVFLDVGAGGWDAGDSLDWRLHGRLGAGLVFGNGPFRGAVDWTVAGSTLLGGAEGDPLQTRGSPGEPEPPVPFGTGPALALVVGDDKGLRVRGGALVDFSPRVSQGVAGWEPRPEAFVALEVPL